MNLPLLNSLHSKGLLSDASLNSARAQQKLFSLHYEIRTILYLGILLLTAGLGILVYKNIDTIGHQAVLLFIAVITVASFYYCVKYKLPFSVQQVKAPNAFFDYVLLLGCSSFIIFVAYFQYQYQVFGERYGLATFVPMLLLFFSAYYFDHLGILSLAITNLAAWLGLAVTPLRILQENDFSNSAVMITGVLLGIFLLLAGFLSQQKNIKAHFNFTYSNFGMHLFFISALAAMFHFETLYLLWFLLIMAACFYFVMRAKKDKTFYTLIVTMLYGYIALSYVMINLLSALNTADMSAVYLGLIYFIASGAGLIVFLMRTNKTWKR